MQKIRDIRIEISGVCNAKCPYCPGSKSDGRAYKFIEVSLFSDIIEHLFAQKILEGGESIGLFCRGEPSIHPRLSEILQILRKHKLKACISSNFINYKEFCEEDFLTIGDMTLSTCGITNECYKRIYGADAEKTIGNFRRFLDQRKKINPSMPTRINWIRYRFNAHEEDAARAMFADDNFEFNSIVGSLINFSEVIELHEKSDADKISEIDKDLFLNEQLQAVKYAASYGVFLHYCDVGNDLIIDELGRWIRCSYISPQSDDFTCGAYKDINIENVTSQKLGCDTCRKCINYAVANSVYSPESMKYLDGINDVLGSLDVGAKVVIYGFGFIGFSIFAKLVSLGFRGIKVIDDSKAGSDIVGIRIQGLNEFNFSGDETVVLSAVNKNTIKRLSDNIAKASKQTKVITLI